jgi:hypothetical protein
MAQCQGTPTGKPSWALPAKAWRTIVDWVCGMRLLSTWISHFSGPVSWKYLRRPLLKVVVSLVVARRISAVGGGGGDAQPAGRCFAW